VHVSLAELLYRLQPLSQADAIGDLYRQPRPCIEFQDHRPALLVDNEITADIAEIGHVVALGAQ